MGVIIENQTKKQKFEMGWAKSIKDNNKGRYVMKMLEGVTFKWGAW